MSARKSRAQNRSVYGIHEDSSTGLTPQSRKKTINRGAHKFRYEFYPLYEGSLTVTAINQELARYQWTYNHYQPQDSLNLMTLMAYYQQLTLAA